jgi:hypothetical protein
VTRRKTPSQSACQRRQSRRPRKTKAHPPHPRRRRPPRLHPQLLPRRDHRRRMRNRRMLRRERLRLGRPRRPKFPTTTRALSLTSSRSSIRTVPGWRIRSTGSFGSPIATWSARDFPHTSPPGTGRSTRKTTGFGRATSPSAEWFSTMAAGSGLAPTVGRGSLVINTRRRGSCGACRPPSTPTSVGLPRRRSSSGGAASGCRSGGALLTTGPSARAASCSRVTRATTSCTIAGSCGHSPARRDVTRLRGTRRTSVLRRKRRASRAHPCRRRGSQHRPTN